MRVTPYRDRDAAELRKALRWAQRRLRLRDWKVGLVLDEQLDASPRLSSGFEPNTNALLWMDDCRLGATIALRLSRCEEINEDPLHVLFHEVGHLLFHCACLTVGRTSRNVDLWEQTTARIADVLYALWLAEGNE